MCECCNGELAVDRARTYAALTRVARSMPPLGAAQRYYEDRAAAPPAVLTIQITPKDTADRYWATCAEYPQIHAPGVTIPHALLAFAEALDAITRGKGDR